MKTEEEILIKDIPILIKYGDLLSINRKVHEAMKDITHGNTNDAFNKMSDIFNTIWDIHSTQIKPEEIEELIRTSKIAKKHSTDLCKIRTLKK